MGASFRNLFEVENRGSFALSNDGILLWKNSDFIDGHSYFYTEVNQHESL